MKHTRWCVEYQVVYGALSGVWSSQWCNSSVRCAPHAFCRGIACSYFLFAIRAVDVPWHAWGWEVPTLTRRLQHP